MSDKVYNAFDKKYIFCGDYAIQKAYSLPYFLDVPRSDFAGLKNFEDNSARQPKRGDNLKRARDSVAQIVYANLTPHTKFLTLTVKDTVLFIPEFQRKVTTFLQAMKRKGYDLEYILVYERQKKRGKKEGNIGCIHAHLIVFNDEKIDMNVLKSCWKHGRVELKILDGLRCKNDKVSEELIRNPASYVCKYITKESVAEWNEKVFRTSKGLKKPIVINNEVYVYSGGGAVTKDSEALNEFFQSEFTPFYENSKICRCSAESKEYERFLDVTISKRKDL